MSPLNNAVSINQLFDSLSYHSQINHSLSRSALYPITTLFIRSLTSIWWHCHLQSNFNKCRCDNLRHEEILFAYLPTKLTIACQESTPRSVFRSPSEFLPWHLNFGFHCCCCCDKQQIRPRNIWFRREKTMKMKVMWWWEHFITNSFVLIISTTQSLCDHDLDVHSDYSIFISTELG